MNLNQLKDIAQKKKGRDVPCDALESALEIVEELQLELEHYKSLWKTCEVDFVSLQGKSNEIIAELKAENEKLKEVIIVVNSCLSDFIITEHGIKIVNQKDLDDAQTLLKETLEQNH